LLYTAPAPAVAWWAISCRGHINLDVNHDWLIDDWTRGEIAAPARITREEMLRRAGAGEVFATSRPEGRWIADTDDGIYDEDAPAPEPPPERVERIAIAL